MAIFMALLSTSIPAKRRDPMGLILELRSFAVLQLVTVKPPKATASAGNLAGQAGLYPTERIGVIPGCEERIGVVPVHDKHQGIKYRDGLQKRSGGKRRARTRNGVGGREGGR